MHVAIKVHSADNALSSVNLALMLSKRRQSSPVTAHSPHARPLGVSCLSCRYLLFPVYWIHLLDPGFFFPWSGSDSLLQSVLQSRHFFGRLRLRLLMAKVPEPTPAPTYLALQHWLQSFVALTSVWDMVIFSWILIIIFFLSPVQDPHLSKNRIRSGKICIWISEKTF